MNQLLNSWEKLNEYCTAMFRLDYYWDKARRMDSLSVILERIMK